jgi:predicted O-methyltransferase YrrM
VTQEVWTEVDHYISNQLVPSDPALEAALANSSAAGLPPIAVSPNEGKLLTLLARMTQATSILEIGTLGGYSTIWLGRALPENGRLVTLEAEPHHAEVARSNIAAAGLAAAVDVRVGPALEVLPEIDGPFDLIFIDADKHTYPDYFQWAVRLSRPGTVIVADNVVRSGKVTDSSTEDADVAGIRRMYELIAAEPRVEATALQTVGARGHDGLAIVVVTG